MEIRLKIMKYLLKLLNDFYLYFIEIVKKIHSWLSCQDIKKSHPIRGFNIILMGVNGFLIYSLIMPNILDYIGLSPSNIALVILVCSIAISLIEWCIVCIVGKRTGQEFEIPARYKFFGSLFFMPLLILLNKLTIWIVSFKKNYVQKIKTNN